MMLGTYKNAAEMVDLYVDLINRFPAIIALIDPFRKEVTGIHLELYNNGEQNLILLAWWLEIVQFGVGWSRTLSKQRPEAGGLGGRLCAEQVSFPRHLGVPMFA